MDLYPYYEELRNAAQNMNRGNFGLWYNKLIPLNPSAFKASDASGNDNKAVDYYVRQYNAMQAASRELLKKKHRDQIAFCERFARSGHEITTVKAKLRSPLITGIGETHPKETSMVFDHNMGIPYIPSSGIKGIVRFTHTLSLIQEARDTGKIINNKFDDEEPWTLIPKMFGTQQERGRVIFLDAYSQEAPELHADIMNPHYGPYYQDTGTKPPADYYNPVPIKFLTVKAGAVFIFRTIAPKQDDLPQKIRDTLRKALTEEGVGAKTAVGYGRFDIISGISVEQRAQPSVAEWPGAVISWNPGQPTIVKAAWQGKKAEGQGKDMIPEALRKRVIDNRKSALALVTVEPIGNGYRVIGIREAAS